MGSTLGALFGTVGGGISYDEQGTVTWDWEGAASGYFWGSVTGFVGGGLGGFFANVGSKLPKFLYFIIQGGINGGISFGLSAFQGVVTNSFSWTSVGIASFFGFLGGGLGITKFGQVRRGVVAGGGLGIAQASVEEIIEFYNSTHPNIDAVTRICFIY